MRKLSIPSWEKKLDNLVKEIVFLRDKDCVTCPIWYNIKPETHHGSNVMQPGHLIKRGCKTVRWNLKNVYKQCKTCNYLHNYYPEVLANYVLSVLDVAGFEDLVFDGYQVSPSIKAWQLEEMYNELKEVLDKGLYKI